MVARGEVWWYEPPEAGRRPYLILTRSEVVGVLNQVFAVPATTVVRRIPTEVALDERDGMPTLCVLALDGATQIRPAFCTGRITTLSAERMQAVCAALSAAVDC